MQSAPAHAAPLLAVQQLHFSYHTASTLSNVSLTLEPGQIIAILGPNGSGKSTLLKLLLGHLPCQAPILWQGRPLVNWPRRELARVVAYLPQTPTWEPAQSIADALRLGRAPYWGALGLESADDEKTLLAVAQSLELSDLLDRRMDELSGGQRQRVLFGRCLVQEPAAMLLDEPDTYLDLKHQFDLSNLLRDLARRRNMAFLLASHDLNLAASLADQIILLHQGEIAASGPPGEVLTEEILSRVYGLAMERIERAGGRVVIVPRG
jgi:ABC-type cobalamin/Fe3+-siderophores transport system ATPase subunit